MTYADLEQASTVVPAGLEPEDEAGMVFLRLRSHEARHDGCPRDRPGHASHLAKLNARLRDGSRRRGRGVGVPRRARPTRSRQGRAIILVGERLATSPGALLERRGGQLAARTGARLAWVPRRAGDRGAVETGCLPNLLPGGRPVADPVARADVASAWGGSTSPTPGTRRRASLAAPRRRAGVWSSGGLDDTPTRRDARGDRGGVLRRGARAARDRRDPGRRRRVPGRPGGRQGGHVRPGRAGPGPFEQNFSEPVVNCRGPGILAGIADGDGPALGFRTVAEGAPRWREIPRDGDRATLEGLEPERPRASRARRAATSRPTRKPLVEDNGSMRDGAGRGNCAPGGPRGRLSQAAYDAHGPTVTLTGDRGSVTIPAEPADRGRRLVRREMPANSFGNGVLADLAHPAAG